MGDKRESKRGKKIKVVKKRQDAEKPAAELWKGSQRVVGSSKRRGGKSVQGWS